MPVVAAHLRLLRAGGARRTGEGAAAVDHQRLAGDVARPSRREKEHRAADVPAGALDAEERVPRTRLPSAATKAIEFGVKTRIA